MKTFVKRNIRQELTDKVVEAMKESGLEWIDYLKGTGPACNAVTNRPYRGFNIMSTAISSWVHGFKSNRWLTFNQARSAGGSVKKGQKGTLVGFYKMVDVEDGETGETKSVPVMKGFTVFNVEQCENLPDEYYGPAATFTKVERVEKAETIMKKSGAVIKHKHDTHAFYNPKTDHIVLPFMKDCKSTEQYYGAALHELVHWTGAENRLGREAMTGTRTVENYAFEELVAELGSLYLAHETGILHDVKNQAAYLKHWVKILENDSTALFKASALANKAVDYIEGLGAKAKGTKKAAKAA